MIMINLHTKLEASKFTHSTTMKIQKAMQNVEFGMVRVTKVIANISIQHSVYDVILTSTETMHQSSTVFEL